MPTMSWPKPDISRVVKANFDPNQPRVPRGNPDGGQWTSVGGASPRIRIAQNVPPEEERDFEDASPASEAELAALNAEGQELIRRVREIDPTWSPRESLLDPTHIDGQIAAARGERDEAEARLRELGQLSAEDLAEAVFHRDRDLLGDPLLSHGNNVVAVCRANGMPSIGVNFGAPGPLYTPRDGAGVMGLRAGLIEDDPNLGEGGNLGEMPLNALFHAETTSLLRAARANGGTLEGEDVEVYVRGEICNNCRAILPKVIKRLGNPTVRFKDRRGYYGTIRDGKWQ